LIDALSLARDGREILKLTVCQIHHSVSTQSRGADRKLNAAAQLQIILTIAVQPVATRRQSVYLHKPAVVIVTSFSLWRQRRHAHRYGRTNVRTYGHLIPSLIYRDMQRNQNPENSRMRTDADH